MLLSYLPLKRIRAIPKFLKYTLAIARQLQRSKGLLGYSLQAELLSREFWTLSVWQDEDALMAFVRQEPHRDVMKRLLSEMGETKFAKWRERGSRLPASWTEAKARMPRS